MPASSERDEFLAWEAMKAGAYEEAVNLLVPLAEGNSAYALLCLGWIYESGATAEPDRDGARALYEQAAAVGSDSAYHYLGWLLFREGRETQARAAFERGAQLDNDECKSALARLNDNAEEKAAAQAFEEENFEEAVRLLRPLAERNSEYALFTLGYIYELGVTGTPDERAARSYYKRAAAQGSAEAYFNLGRLLAHEGEEAEARAAFQAGAERGNLSSMSRLGEMMVDGRGGPADLDAGIAWLEKAAAKGHIFSQRSLLALEHRDAKSLLEKLSIKLKIIALAIKGAKAMSNDPRWEVWLRYRPLRSAMKRKQT